MHTRFVPFNHTHALFTALLTALAQTACGSDSGSKSEDTRMLADLSAKEAQEVCETTLSQQREVLMLMCIEELVDLIDSGDIEKAHCSEEWDGCVTKVEEVVSAACVNGVLPKSTCEATVDDFLDCYEGLAKASKNLLEVMSCADLDSKVDDKLDNALRDAIRGPACAKGAECQPVLARRSSEVGG